MAKDAKMAKNEVDQDLKESQNGRKVQKSTKRQNG